MELIEKALGACSQTQQSAAICALDAGVAEACVAVLRARVSQVALPVLTLCRVASSATGNVMISAARLRRSIAAGAVEALCEALSDLTFGDAGDEGWVGARGELAGLCSVVLGCLIHDGRAGADEIVSRIIAAFGALREQKRRGTMVLALCTAISGVAKMDRVDARNGSSPPLMAASQKALAGAPSGPAIPLFYALMAAERTLAAEFAHMRSLAEQGGPSVVHHQWKTPAEAAEERRVLCGALATAVRATGGYVAALRCCAKLVLTLVEMPPDLPLFDLVSVFSPTAYLSALLDCGMLEALAEAGLSPLHTARSFASEFSNPPHFWAFSWILVSC